MRPFEKVINDFFSVIGWENCVENFSLNICKGTVSNALSKDVLKGGGF